MQKVFSEKLNANLSRLGFGAMRLPVTAAGDIDRPAALQMVRRAVEAGVNYFDTAWMYHNQKSEPFIGEALKEFEGREIYLADKLPLSFLKREEDMEEIFAEQLTRCGVKKFQFYLAHGYDDGKREKFKALRVYEFLQRKRNEGKIERLGFSFHGTPECLAGFLDGHRFDFVQIQLNYLDWAVQRGEQTYNVLAERGMPCFVMEPLRGGYLAGLPGSAAEALGEGGDAGRQAAMGMRWCASLPAVTVVLSGMSTMEQLNGNISVFERPEPLSREERGKVDAARAALLEMKSIPCTGCRYCAVCPEGVKIPEIFSLYNSFEAYGDKIRTRHTYNNVLPAGGRADGCVSCGSCSAACPQHLDIPELLKTAHARLAQ